MGDGVYASLPGSEAEAQCRDSGAELYVLEQDAVVAGIEPATSFEVIGMSGFVELTERFSKQQAWY